MKGHTSSISHQILGFDAEGKVTNISEYKNRSWPEIFYASTKILTFIDVAGHAKYAKTLVSGISSCLPDYAMICINANKVTDTCRDHFKLVFAFKLPLIIIITKIDTVDEDQMYETLDEINDILSEDESDRQPLNINDTEDAVLCSRNMGEYIVPIFKISSKTGKNIHLFLQFLNLLPLNPNNEWEEISRDSPEFHIFETFQKKSDPCTILCGTVTQGTISVKRRMVLGPDKNGVFRNVDIKAIECKKIKCKQVSAGQICAIAINLGEKAQKWLETGGGIIRKGMVLADPKTNPKGVWAFDADIWTYDGEDKFMSINHQPIIHTSHVRQASRLIRENDSEDSFFVSPSSRSKSEEITKEEVEEDEDLKEPEQAPKIETTKK